MMMEEEDAGLPADKFVATVEWPVMIEEPRYG